MALLSEVFSTDYGSIKITASHSGICGIELIYPPIISQKERSLKQINDPTLGFMQDFLTYTRGWISSYFKGYIQEFKIPLDLSRYTSFQRDVWFATQKIPYGQLQSYKWVAEQIGNSHSYRAVGQALAKNPVPIIIPCHRVIRTDGSIGGFSAGLYWKQILMEIEGSWTFVRK